MDRERIRKLAKHIEKCQYFHPEKYTGEEQKPTKKMFAMSRVFFDNYCKTPACIAGHTIAMFYDGEYDESFHFNQISLAKSLLDLSDEQAEDLFMPDFYYANYREEDEVMPDFITVEKAVDALRYLAATGTVDWES